MKGSGRGLIKALTRNFNGWSRKRYEDSQSPGRDLKLRLPEYKARLPTAPLQRYIFNIKIVTFTT
jgi:hypothetical protein